MKNFVKWVGLIALAAIIGFSMTACPNPTETPPTGNNNQGNPGTTYTTFMTGLGVDLAAYNANFTTLASTPGAVSIHTPSNKASDLAKCNTLIATDSFGEKNTGVAYSDITGRLDTLVTGGILTSAQRTTALGHLNGAQGYCVIGIYDGTNAMFMAAFKD
jgi:hypothetical protein